MQTFRFFPYLLVNSCWTRSTPTSTRAHFLCVTGWLCGCFWYVKTSVLLLAWSLSPEVLVVLDPLFLFSEILLPWPPGCWSLFVLLLRQWHYSSLLCPSLTGFPQDMLRYKCYTDYRLIPCPSALHLRASLLLRCQMSPLWKWLPKQHLWCSEAHLRQYFQVNMWKSNESSFPPWSPFHSSDFTGLHLLNHF